MELTQEEIKWIKDKYAEETVMRIAVEKDKLIQQARESVALQYKEQLDLLARDGRIEERKALIEQMITEAYIAEQLVLGNL